MNEENDAPEWMRELLAEHKPPCVSMYLSAPLGFPGNEQTAIRMSNLIRLAEDSLKERYSDQDVRAMLNRLRQINAGNSSLEGMRQGLALFVCSDYQRSIALREGVADAVEVADHFYIKPLIGMFQNSDRYQMLCLQMDEVTMWEGGRLDFGKLEDRDLPQSPEMVAGMTLSKQATAHSDRAESPRQSAQGPGAPIEPANQEQFFAAVDRAVWENYSRISRLPLILCTAAEHQDCFRRLSKNQYLYPAGVSLDPHAMSPQRLREEAWKIIEPRTKKKMEELNNQFKVAKAHEQGSDELLKIAEAAARGRVGSLMLQNDYQMQGFVNPANGAVETADLQNPHAGDVLDELAAMVLKADGNVVLLTPENMPTDTGIAAIYRY